MSSPFLALAEPMLQEEVSRGGRNSGKIIMLGALLLGGAALFSLPYSHHETEPLDLWTTARGGAPMAAARTSPAVLKPWMAPASLGARLRALNPSMSFGRSRVSPGAANIGSRIAIRADDDIDSKVKKMIAENLSVDEDKITPQASFIEDLGADSLDTVELLMAMEEQFGVEIPEEEAQKLTTVQAVIDYAKNQGAATR